MIGGKFNLGSLMKNAKKIQEMMEKAQDDLVKIIVTGESGAGMVVVSVNAQHEVLDVQLSDELLKESKEVIQDLVKAAFNDAGQKVSAITQEKMMSASTMFGSDENEE
jgi:nucleoid-associated protein EbfC